MFDVNEMNFVDLEFLKRPHNLPTISKKTGHCAVVGILPCQGERRESLKEEMLFGRVYKCKVC